MMSKGTHFIFFILLPVLSFTVVPSYVAIADTKLSGIKKEISKPHELRDDSGKLLGKIRQRSDGKFEGRDQSGKLKGTYDPKTNQTRDTGGKLVGTGNLLPILVVAP